MVWKLVGTTCVALIVLVALHLFSTPLSPSLFRRLRRFVRKFWAQTAVHSTRAVAGVSFVL